MKIEKLLFVHIPKTAGLSLNNQLKNVFGKNASIRFGNSSSVQKFETLSKSELRNYSYITGHIPLQKFRDKGIDYPAIVVIRQPVDRLLSTYKYLQASIHPDHQKLKFENIESFISHIQLNPLRWDNTQCRFIGTSNTCSASIKVLQEDIIYPVPLTYFNDMIEKLSLILPQSIKNVHLNKSDRLGEDKGKEVIEAELKSLLKEDLQLYTIVTQRYTQMRDTFFKKLSQLKSI